jgi:hypothetical protein
MMSEPTKSSDINISKIPVDGIGGLGLVAGAAIIAIAVPALRWLAIAGLVGGAAIGLFLIGSRNRRARRGAEIGGLILFIALATGAFVYFGR